MADIKQDSPERMESYAIKPRHSQWMSEEYEPGLVSVIIPTYNRGHLIRRAIESVLNQTYQDFEIIVVDDGSTDHTRQIVMSFADPRIQFLENDISRGASAARNAALEICKGEYIAFIDDDDEWLPRKLEKQMKAFEIAPHEVGVVYTRFWKVKDRAKNYVLLPKMKKEGAIDKALLQGNFIALPSAVVRKECFAKAGVFDEHLTCFHDWEFFIRISKHYHFKCIGEPLLIVYPQKKSISSDQDARIKALELILQKHFEEFAKKRKLLAKQYIDIGNLLVVHKKTQNGRGYLVKAIKLYPFNIKLLLVIFFTFFGLSVYKKAVGLLWGYVEK